jgi:hypothetical protein
MTNKKTRKVAEKKVVTTKVVATTDAEATEETLATEEAVVTYTGEFLIVRSTPKRQLNKEGG